MVALALIPRLSGAMRQARGELPRGPWPLALIPRLSGAMRHEVITHSMRNSDARTDTVSQWCGATWRQIPNGLEFIRLALIPRLSGAMRLDLNPQNLWISIPRTDTPSQWCDARSVIITFLFPNRSARIDTPSQWCAARIRGQNRQFVEFVALIRRLSGALQGLRRDAGQQKSAA
jgi:hypothetical protein